MDRKNTLLRYVRDVQQYLAIGAEILLLMAFFTSGMDVSLGGTMADMEVFKWIWAVVFALGVDTAFVLSWVRVRQIGKGWQQCWAVPLALGLSFVVFQPVAVQLLQQSLSISFNQALSYLGFDVVILVYARAFVAVCLGGILALTNVESKQVEATIRPKRTLLIWQNLLNKYAPIEQDVQPMIQENVQESEQIPVDVPTSIRRTPLKVVKPQKVDTHEQAIRILLQQDRTLSAHAVAKTVGCTPSTANKWKKRIVAEKEAYTLEATGGN